MKGFFNRIAVVDLTAGQFSVESVADETYERYMGGKGLASYLLCEMNPPRVDPLAPDNHLIFATGPATGTVTWGSSRYGVFTKSPLTNFYCESYSGGRVPEKISATGYDAIVFKGKADRLTVVEIDEDGIEFHDARDLSGLDTFETESRVKKMCPDAGVVVVGAAAENGVAFATIKNDGYRCAGRTGAGTVLGSKNVKAVAFRGKRKRTIHDQKTLSSISKDLAAESKEHPGVKAYKTMGTSQLVNVLNTVGAFPSEYWKKGHCSHYKSINADALHDRCEIKPHACAKCFLACGRMGRVKEGRHKGMELEGPEYETIYAFGGLCMIDSIEEIAFLNRLCDSLGMDTITTGNLCSFAMEAYSLGKSDFEIRYGDVENTEELIRRIAEKQGIGEILAKGIVHAARHWDMEDRAVHVKGLEPAGYDPRVLKGMGLGYATSDRGACHLRATFYKPELSGVIEPDAIEGKAEVFIDYEDRLTIFDTLILCRFFRDLYTWELLEEAVAALTGIDGSKESLKRIAGNIAGKVREFNVKEGLQRSDENLPAPFFNPLEDSGAGITEDEFNHLLEDYYRIRGF